MLSYHCMASSLPLSRPHSLPNVRSSPTSSRSSLIATLEPFRTTGGATGTTVPSASNSANSKREMFNYKPRKQRRVNAQKGFSGPLIQTLPGTFEPPYEQFLVIKSLDGASVIDLDIEHSLKFADASLRSPPKGTVVSWWRCRPRKRVLASEQFPLSLERR